MSMRRFIAPLAACLLVSAPLVACGSSGSSSGGGGSITVRVYPLKSEADDKAFFVTLARSGRRVEVPANVSILEALRAAGLTLPSSCESGTCGTCKTKLVSGEVDHRDLALADHEKATNIMICVSRAARGDLVLDL